MTPEEAAAALNGNECGNEGSGELFSRMKDAGLVAVFGHSDDLMEFRGAIRDEVDAWDGTTVYLDQDGLLKNECPQNYCPYFNRLKENARTIDALYCDEDGLVWTYRTDIPHVTFLTKDEGEPYCRGIVFRLSDARRKLPISPEVAAAYASPSRKKK